jgi:hypothetical protein
VPRLRQRPIDAERLARSRLWAALVAGLLAVASPAAFAGEAPQGASMPPWMQWDPATKTVRMEIASGNPPSANGGWNFNGYHSGNATIVVPLNASADIAYKNIDQLQHSLVVISGEGPLPPQGGDPAFPRAFSIRKVEGIPPGGSDNVRFTADKAGRYRIFCGVPGHGVAGMWIWFEVSPTAEGPGVVVQAAAAGATPGAPAPATHASPHAK